jgi:hypothetical protein
MITPQAPVEVVFHHNSTQSAIQRRDPPTISARGVRIDNPELTSTLFKAYKVREKPRQFFTLGRVFLVLWSEPAGGTSLVTKWAPGTVINHLGERVFSKVRRFVVIREGGTYCNALSINTYVGRGVAKPGVIKSEHVIIFTGSTPPEPTEDEMATKRGEAPMRPIAIKVDADSPSERLDPMSRLDLGGVTNVQHNIKVKALGRVNIGSLDALRSQYANVQNNFLAQDMATQSSSTLRYKATTNKQQVWDEGGDDGDDDEEEEEDPDEEDEEDDIEDDGCRKNSNDALPGNPVESPMTGIRPRNADTAAMESKTGPLPTKKDEKDKRRDGLNSLGHIYEGAEKGERKVV